MTDIDGTWLLLAATGRDAERKPLPLPYGPTPIGRIVFEGGRMLCAVCDGRTDLPAGEARAFTSYGGPYSLDGTRLVTRVDVASDPKRIGQDEVREIAFRDGLLVITNNRTLGVQRELIWTKLGEPSRCVPSL